MDIKKWYEECSKFSQKYFSKQGTTVTFHNQATTSTEKKTMAAF